MGNAAFAYDNLADADAATTVVAGALTEAPASRLQNPHVARACRVNATSMSILTDLGSSVVFDANEFTVGLIGTNLTTAALTRVRASDSDPTGVDGAAYDSTEAAGRIDERYGNLILLATPVITARYVLIDLSESGVAYVEAGRLFIGPRVEAGINFAPGWSRTAVRRSRDTEGVSGQTFVDLQQGYRAVDVTFSWLSEAEKNGFVEDIEVATVNDGHLDMLWIKDVDSANLGRDCVWGYIEGEAPVTQPLPIDVFSKAMRIRQRL